MKLFTPPPPCPRTNISKVLHTSLTGRWRGKQITNSAYWVPLSYQNFMSTWNPTPCFLSDYWMYLETCRTTDCPFLPLKKARTLIQLIPMSYRSPYHLYWVVPSFVGVILICPLYYMTCLLKKTGNFKIFL